MAWNRRTFLTASGLSLALPWMESLGGFAYAEKPVAAPQRLLMVCLPLGIYRDAIIPGEAGAKYQSPDYLSLIDDFRDRYTVISGLDHPGVNGGHSAEPRIFYRRSFAPKECSFARPIPGQQNRTTNPLRFTGSLCRTQ